MNASFDPYALTEKGVRIDKLAIKNEQGIGRIQSFTASTGYKFSNSTFKKKEKNAQRTDDFDQRPKQKEIETMRRTYF